MTIEINDTIIELLYKMGYINNNPTKTEVYYAIVEALEDKNSKDK